jgi:hypothetical protein
LATKIQLATPRLLSIPILCDRAFFQNFELSRRAAIALCQLIGNVLVDFCFDPMVAVANLHRLGEIPGTDQTPDVCVTKLDAFF